MAQHTKAVLKSVFIAPVDPVGKKGCSFVANLLQLLRGKIGKKLPHFLFSE